MIRAVLFDMDGILCDSEHFYMEGTIDQMRAYGYTGPAEKIYGIIGTTMDGTYDLLYDLLDHKVDRETIRKNNEDYFSRLHPVPYKEIMFPRVPEMLQKLRALGLQTACCSSSPYETILKSLQAMGIDKDFDYIASSDQFTPTKPAPDIYLAAAKALGRTPQECIVYEDSTMGIAAGKNAGMEVIAREDRRYGQDQSQADRIVKDIAGFYAAVAEEIRHD